MSGLVKLKLPLGGSKTISAPDSASDETITLPAGTKTLQATDDTIASSRLTGALPAISGAALTNLPGGGKVLKVVQDNKTDTWTTTAGPSWSQIPGLQVNITPASSSSKMLVSFDITTACANGQRYGLRLHRNGNWIDIATSVGSRTAATSTGDGRASNGTDRNISITFLDEPGTTSPLQYNVYAAAENTSLLCVNRSYSDVDTASVFRGTSSITVMEIGA